MRYRPFDYAQGDIQGERFRLRKQPEALGAPGVRSDGFSHSVRAELALGAPAFVVMALAIPDGPSKRSALPGFVVMALAIPCGPSKRSALPGSSLSSLAFLFPSFRLGSSASLRFALSYGNRSVMPARMNVPVNPLAACSAATVVENRRAML